MALWRRCTGRGSARRVLKLGRPSRPPGLGADRGPPIGCSRHALPIRDEAPSPFVRALTVAFSVEGAGVFSEPRPSASGLLIAARVSKRSSQSRARQEAVGKRGHGPLDRFSALDVARSGAAGFNRRRQQGSDRPTITITTPPLPHGRGSDKNGADAICCSFAPSRSWDGYERSRCCSVSPDSIGLFDAVAVCRRAVSGD